MLAILAHIAIIQNCQHRPRRYLFYFWVQSTAVGEELSLLKTPMPRPRFATVKGNSVALLVPQEAYFVAEMTVIMYCSHGHYTMFRIVYNKNSAHLCIGHTGYKCVM